MPNLTGQSIGRYHILEQLGEGGMATVYKAYDTRLERNVALKVLRTNQFIPAQLQMVLQRFEREAKSLAKLKHSNIVNILDFGEHEGMPYLVMEYLPGGTLKQKLGQAIPWQEAIQTLLPVARGLSYTHQHGVIHRDVKPANVLIDQNEEPILTDFGIAKLLEGADGHTLTASGVGIGTPEYMAPEQGIGASTIDARADIYSLGIMLYEMVTGRKPYTADTPMAVVLKQMTDPLPRPTDFVPDLPEGVERILLKALAKQPEDRYVDMNAMINSMESQLVETQKNETPASAVSDPIELVEEKTIPPRTRSSYKRAVFGAFGAIVILIFGILFALQISFFAGRSPTTTVTVTLTKIAIPTITPLPTATPLPFAWIRLNSGQFLPRDIITSIVVDLNDPDIVYVGTQNAGIYKSLDGGSSWQPANNGISRVMISSLAIDPENSSKLYAATRSGHLFVTDDAGNNWEDITPQSAQFSDSRTYIFIDPQNSAHLYYSDSQNIFESSDQGSSWQEFKKDCSSIINSITFQRDSADNAAIYISTDNPSDCEPGVYRTSDRGVTWEYLGPDDPNFGQFWLLLVGMKPADGHLIFGMQGHAELFTSFDDGKSWTTANQQCNTFFTNPSTAILCGGYNGLSISRDEGRSWQNIPGIEKQVTAIWASDDLTRIILGISEGLIISNDSGKTWTDHSSGLGARRLELELSPDSSHLFVRDRTQGPIGTGLSCCSQNDLFYSTDGQNWELASSQGYGLAVDANGTTLYRAQENILLISPDNGKTWKKQSFPFWVDRSDLGLFAHPKQSGLLYAADDNERTLFISEDSGLTWEKYNPQYEHLASTQLFFGQEKTLYMVPFYQAFRSVDGGKTWKVCGGEIETIPSMRRLAVDPRDDNRVFIANIEKGLLYSTDACKSWEMRNKGLEKQVINSITIDPNEPDTLYLGTDGGAYISFNRGQSWSQANDGLFGTLVVYSIVVDKDSNVYAATPYGIFKLEKK